MLLQADDPSLGATVQALSYPVGVKALQCIGFAACYERVQLMRSPKSPQYHGMACLFAKGLTDCARAFACPPPRCAGSRPSNARDLAAPVFAIRKSIVRLQVSILRLPIHSFTLFPSCFRRQRRPCRTMLRCGKRSAMQVLPAGRCQDMETFDQQFLCELEMELDKRELQAAICCLALRIVLRNFPSLAASSCRHGQF